MTSAQELEIPPAYYPEVIASGANADAFVPSGWAIEQQASGDISGDGQNDLAIVVKQANPAFILKNEGFGERLLDTNPRILIVALGSSAGYRLAAANHRLIPRHEIPTLSDPFGEDGNLAIERGALKVSLFHFANMGGWDMGPTHFTFRWRENALQLIGYDRSVVLRNQGTVTSLSINFLSRRVRTSHGKIDEDRETIRWHNYKPVKLQTIDQIGSWDEFDPGGWVDNLFG